MAKLIFTMSSGRDYTSNEITDKEAYELIKEIMVGIPAGFVTIGSDDTLINPHHVEAVKVVFANEG